MSLHSFLEKHVVVVEDDEVSREMMTGFFRERGFKVTVFEDAESALAEFEADLVCDVVVSDLQLPVLSGVDLVKRLKEIGILTPVIIMTATKSSLIAKSAIDFGAYDFLLKPIHFDQLLLSVERALQMSIMKGEIESLRRIVKEKEGSVSPGMIGRSPGFLNALDISKRVAKSTASIIIYGESGTGKEVIARYIHKESDRSRGPFVAINCGAIPENLLESELFGHAKGSFTGAITKRIGLFEEAENGTLFLDEIGDLGLPLQAKLLRVLQEKMIKRVGENVARPINARIISATHRDLAEEVAAKRFREDLFFRLNVIPIRVPSLRHRREDILLLAEHFLKRFAAVNNAMAQSFSKEALQYLLQKSWSGNVRELENAVERAVVLSRSSVIQRDELECDWIHTSLSAQESPKASSEPIAARAEFVVSGAGPLTSLEDVIQQYVDYAVKRNGGAKDKTARDLGIDRKTLYRRILHIENPKSV